MNTMRFNRFALAACVVAALLAGCGRSQLPIGAPVAVPQGRAIAMHTGFHRSRMLPEAKAEDLMYTTNDGGQEVYAYSYPAGTLVGTLGGFVR
jgi:hypothetical protein